MPSIASSRRRDDRSPRTHRDDESSDKHRESPREKERSKQVKSYDDRTSRLGDERSSRNNTSHNTEGSDHEEEAYPKTMREYYKRELERLQQDTTERAKQIKIPKRRKHEPYVFNSLYPYRDIEGLRLAIEQPTDVKHFSVSKNTASGPCDPWISLKLDTDTDQPRPSIATNRYKHQASGFNTPRSRTNQNGGQTSRSTKSPNSGVAGGEKERLQDEDKDGKRESIYPVVVFYRNEFTSKQLDYSDVPKIRTEVKQTYSYNASKKVERDCRKTKAEFRRRGLGNMDELTPASRSTLRQAYLTYLQNNPGSSKAIRQCLHEEDEKLEQKKKASQNGKSDNQSTSESMEKDESSSTGSQGNWSQEKYDSSRTSRTSQRRQVTGKEEEKGD